MSECVYNEPDNRVRKVVGGRLLQLYDNIAFSSLDLYSNKTKHLHLLYIQTFNVIRYNDVTYTVT